jgi:hypothetical protein
MDSKAILRLLLERIFGWVLFFNSLFKLAAAWIVVWYYTLWTTIFSETMTSVSFGLGIAWFIVLFVLILFYRNVRANIASFNRPVKVPPTLQGVEYESAAVLVNRLNISIVICILAWWFGINLLIELAAPAFSS